MFPRPTRSTRTDTLFPYTTLFRSLRREIREADTVRAMLVGVVEQIVLQHETEDAGLLPAVIARPQYRSAFARGFGLRHPAGRLLAARIIGGPRRQRPAGSPGSEERRGGTECATTCRSGGQPHHYQNKQKP